MSGIFRIISTVEELVEASQDRTARYLIIRNDLKDVPCIKLLPFQSLSGEFDGKTLSFTENSDGICLTKSNEIKNLKIVATPTKRAIFQDQEIDAIGNQLLSRINVTGQITFIFNNNIKKGRIEASFVHVEYASTNHLTERPNQ